jgi:hypothetical protein
VKKKKIKYQPRRKLRVIMLADEKLLPIGDLKDFSEKQRELRKTEFDVRDALEQLGHEVVAIGVSDDLSTIRGAIDAHKPHIAFNLVEEFDGIGHFDQHVVSYLELRKQPYTGCNPRGLTLARDKALTKKILAYEGIKVPGFAIFPQRRSLKRPDRLGFPLFVKSLTEEGSAGISSASIVNDDEKLAERVSFIHRTTKSTAIAEEFIDGREIYVGWSIYPLGDGRLQPPSPPPIAKLGSAPFGASDRVGSTRRAFGPFGPLKYPLIASRQSGFNPTPPVSMCAFSALRRRGSHVAWMCFAIPSSASAFG